MKTYLPLALGILTVALVLGLVAPRDAFAGRGPRLVRVGTWPSGTEGGTDVLSVQASTHRMAVTQRSLPAVVILDLTEPDRPTEIGRISIRSAANEELTSVAFHPTHDVVFVTMNRREPRGRGRVLIVNATTGRAVADHPVGFGPDHVVVSPQGDVAVVVNEGEQFWFDRRKMTFHSMPGGYSVIDLSKGCARSTVHSYMFKDLTGRPGLVEKAHQRTFDRAVDLNGNGTIEPNETDIQVPLSHNQPGNIEPEYVAFAPDGSRAYITLQENNGVVVIDPRAQKVVAVYGLGTTTHVSDTEDDGSTAFDDELFALREPDGIAVTPDGKYFVTADEGDTGPKAADTTTGLPAGGGRTVSVFDAATGAFVGDTGNQLDAAAASAGIYPDKRSDSKGSEPENVVIFTAEGNTFAAVSLERANGVALIDLAEPDAPRVIGVWALEKGSIGPEGLAVYQQAAGPTYVYSANEVSGDVSIFHFRQR